MMSERDHMKRPNTEGIAGNVLKGAVAGAARVWLMDRVGWFLYRREDPAAVQREQAARVEGKNPPTSSLGRWRGHSASPSLLPSRTRRASRSTTRSGSCRGRSMARSGIE